MSFKHNEQTRLPIESVSSSAWAEFLMRASIRFFYTLLLLLPSLRFPVLLCIPPGWFCYFRLQNECALERRGFDGSATVREELVIPKAHARHYHHTDPFHYSMAVRCAVSCVCLEVVQKTCEPGPIKIRNL